MLIERQGGIKGIVEINLILFWFAWKTISSLRLSRWVRVKPSYSNYMMQKNCVRPKIIKFQQCPVFPTDISETFV